MIVCIDKKLQVLVTLNDYVRFSKLRLLDNPPVVEYLSGPDVDLAKQEEVQESQL